MLTVRVPGSASNLGAGFDCVGLALDLWLEASLVQGAGPPTYGGTLAALSPADDLVLRTLGGAAPEGHRLEVHSNIPVSRGLGSSGAAIVAGIALAKLVHHEPVDPLMMFDTARLIEGHPDNVAPAVYGGLVLVIEPKPVRLTFDRHFGVACAVPDTHIDTKKARALLPADVSRSVAVTQSANAAALMLGLTTGDPELVRQGMSDSIGVPRRAPLITGFDGAVRAGVDAGAFGVTISGSGSTLLAICPRETAPSVAHAMAGTLAAAKNPAKPLVLNVAGRGCHVVGVTTQDGDDG